MKYLIATIFLSIGLNSFPQTKGKSISDRNSYKITFITKLDITHATKDGIYLNGYVVNIPYEQAQQLNGSKIQVTGRVKIIKAIKNQLNKEIQQGREIETKYIQFPKIKVIKS